jgi:hypothetical protein
MSTDVMLIGSVVHNTGSGVAGGKTIYGTTHNIRYGYKHSVGTFILFVVVHVDGVRLYL